MISVSSAPSNRLTDSPAVARLGMMISQDRSMPFDHPLADPSLQRYRDYARQRQMTLGDLLLENRIIFLEGVINDAAANLAVMKFLYLQYENRTQGISFYINSPGGSVSSTLAIYDTMQFIDCPVATYCIGLAASVPRSCWPAAPRAAASLCRTPRS